VLALGVAACGNSGGDEGSSGTTAPDNGAVDSGAGGEAHRDEHVALSGVPGVSDDEITYTVIGTKSGNPLGTCILDCYVEGIKAYFAFRNDEGGIYGRDLVVGDVVDDQLAANQQKALDLISATSALGDLDSAGIPTYAWGINATEAANRSHIFPSAVIRCSDCSGRTAPYAAKLAGAHHAAALGYGATENSKVCAQTTGKNFDMYKDETGVDSAYVNDNLAYGLPNGIGPEVTKMKEAGVDFIATCIDLNGMKTLAQELERQGMDNVTLLHPNTYNQQFVKDAGSLFEGDFVGVGFRPFEADTEGSALGDFQKWMDELGYDESELAMVGWINASLAFDGLLAAGPEFDRDKVTAATNAMTDWSAGGLLEPINWTEAHTPYTQATRDEDSSDECVALVRIEDGAFQTVAPPDKPWLCWSNTDLSWSDPTPENFG
jgi:hypothetical protein